MGTDLESVLEDLDALEEHIIYLVECKGDHQDAQLWKDRVNLLRGQLKDKYNKGN